MLLPSSRILFLLLGFSPAIALAQSDGQCASAQRALESVVREHPERVVETLTSAVRGNRGCAGQLIESAIKASEASDELVAKLVTAAVRSAPDKAVVIAESAIAAAPSASDEVADVVQTVLGDCRSIAEDVSISIGRNKERLLLVLEDALRSHGNCTCEIVSSAVRAAGGSRSVISQVVETSVALKPSMAAEISECAGAAAPKQIAAVQEGLDRALSDSSRGPGALPAAAEVSEDFLAQDATVTANPASGLAEEMAVVSESPQPTPVTNTASSGQSYGKQSYGYGKGYGKGQTQEVAEEENDGWGWDWIQWGGLGGVGANGGAVYLISPSGGVVPPGELAPLSPSDPKIDDKIEDKSSK
ncbi:MAG: hypothetical protein ACI9DF_004423 [Verrucomicrobiales bacterium]|jgi:hypothetical protein